MTTPLLLIAVAALLLLALVVALVVQHRRERAAVPAGPRTVADLVRQQRERAPAPPVAEAPAAEPEAAPEAPAQEPVAPTPVERVVERRAIGRQAVGGQAVGRQAAEARAEEPVAAPVPVAVDPVAPLGDDVPWRRATQITTAPSAEARSVSSDSRRAPTLALLRRPARRGPGSRPSLRRDAVTRVAERSPERPTAPVVADPASAPVEPDASPTLVAPVIVAVPEPVPGSVPAAPAVEVPAVGPVLEPDPEPAAERVAPAEVDIVPETPVAETPVAETPVAVAPVAVAPVVETPAVEAPVRPRRDPAHLAAEHAAADLALLRTFGTTDLGSRPDRAPVVALERAPVPETPPAGGAAQPVRFRTVRRDGATIADAAVALLDDRGREASTGRSDAAGAGELRAPHPGSYVLVATAPDHQPGAVALTVADASPAVDLLLVRSAALVGTVTGEDGPVDGARVTVVQDGEIVEATNTDGDGRFRVVDLAAGEYAVSVAAAGCEPDVDLVSVADEAEQDHDVDLAPAVVPAG